MKKKLGFTLLEVVIATMILSGAMIVLGGSWSRSLVQLRKGRELNKISFLLKRKISEYELKYLNDKNDILEQESGDFGREYPKFTWKMESKDMEFPDLAPMLVSREGGANEMLLQTIRQMTEKFSEAIKELKVTVIWKTPQKPIEYSVTTYLVDFEKAVGLTGAPGGN